MLLHYFVKYKYSKFAQNAITTTADRARMHEENVAVVDLLVLHQESQPQIHHSTRPVAVYMDYFFTAILVIRDV